MLTLKESIARSKIYLRDDDLVRLRAQLLEAGDRELVRAIWLHEMPASVVARIVGRSPEHVRRRLRRLLARMRSPRFLAAARLMPALTGVEREVARLHVLQGLPLRRLARGLGLPTYRVRIAARAVDTVIRGAGRLVVAAQVRDYGFRSLK